jgi:hypothetical protein
LIQSEHLLRHPHSIDQVTSINNVVVPSVDEDWPELSMFSDQTRNNTISIEHHKQSSSITNASMCCDEHINTAPLEDEDFLLFYEDLTHPVNQLPEDTLVGIWPFESYDVIRPSLINPVVMEWPEPESGVDDDEVLDEDEVQDSQVVRKRKGSDSLERSILQGSRENQKKKKREEDKNHSIE